MRTLLALLLIVSLLATPPSTTGVVHAAAQDDDAVALARASVVTVYTYRPGGTFSPGRSGREPAGAGSGWVYADGVVVTNAHVVDGAQDITVVTPNNAVIAASIVGSDWYQDVAVLRLEPTDGGDLPVPLIIGTGAEVTIEQPVVAIGTPHGRYADTASEGEVIAVEQRINTGNGYSILNLIQHSAALAPGNSGGPLVTADGTVIGMNVASRPSSDATEPVISFAIAIDAVAPLVEEILATGMVLRPWLGVTTDLTADGTRVRTVAAGSPAEASGIRQGDRILAVDGESVTPSLPFIDLLYRHDPGNAVTLALQRDGERVDVVVELEAPDTEQS
jgi:S1-C subfamily serine protease